MEMFLVRVFKNDDAIPLGTWVIHSPVGPTELRATLDQELDGDRLVFDVKAVTSLSAMEFVDEVRRSVL